MRPLIWLVAVVLFAAGAGWLATRPQTVAADQIAGLTGDADAGARVFDAAGCAGCHVAPDAEDEGPPVLAGGLRLQTEFGTFVVPNISSHPEAGIGGWSDAEIVQSVRYGTSPGGAHYYPAFPYSSYRRAELQDLVDLTAHLRTLPADPTASGPHELDFPWSVRSGIGLWKVLNLSPDPVVAGELTEAEARGRYLVEALGHCGECHTPRGPLGGLDTSRWLGGAPNPEGDGRVPNITPGGLDWSEEEIAAFLSSGFTPEFDVVGGQMAEVVRSLSQLPQEDLAAIAAYLKVVPSVASAE